MSKGGDFRSPDEAATTVQTEGTTVKPGFTCSRQFAQATPSADKTGIATEAGSQSMAVEASRTILLRGEGKSSTGKGTKEEPLGAAGTETFMMYSGVREMASWMTDRSL
jgi:hypothetical protein